MCCKMNMLLKGSPSFYACRSFSLFVGMRVCFREPQMVELGRHWWKLSCPTSLLRQVHLEPLAQDHIQMGFQAISSNIQALFSLNVDYFIFLNAKVFE